MHLPDRASFLKQSEKILSGVYDQVAALKPVSLREFEPERTVLVLVDMVNGFAKEGALYSPRIESLIDGTVRLTQQCMAAKISCISFEDRHKPESTELKVYPSHCLVGTQETLLVDELRALGSKILHLPKNSTNGLLEPAFQSWMIGHPKLDHFILAGDCTDICILQFATALRASFDLYDTPCRIVVPVDLVDTFDGGLHDADLLNLFSLFQMQGSGIELASTITD